MIKRYRYNTVTDAIATLREDGFTADFELDGNSVIANGKRFAAKDLKMLVVHRYEGQSDPADEATVYGLETNSGLKGILVMADGVYSDVTSVSILVQLHQSKNERSLKKYSDSIFDLPQFVHL